MEWKEVRLESILALPSRNGLTKPSKIRGKGVKMIGMGELFANPIIYDIPMDRVPVTDKELSNSRIMPGDLLFARQSLTLEGAGKCCYVKEVKEETVFESHLIRIRIDKTKADAEFIYYFFNSFIGKCLIQNLVTQVAAAGIRGSELVKLDITIPKEVEDQRRIASILSSLDRKIELNNKINADLEEMAQAIFKNWFVDFEPFKNGKFVDSELGMIPEGWKVISLSEIMKYNGGSQPPASEFIDTYQEGYIRFIQIRDYDNDSHITYIPISKRNKLCDELDIMIARYGAALGRICWGLKGAYNVALAKVTPIKSYYREYLRCYLNTSYFYQSINNKGARCAQSGFNQSDINSYMIAFPIDETVVMNFNDLCSSIMDKRLSLKYENSRLSTLRDTLLPRLMSGEIEVPE